MTSWPPAPAEAQRRRLAVHQLWLFWPTIGVIFDRSIPIIVLGFSIPFAGLGTPFMLGAETVLLIAGACAGYTFSARVERAFALASLVFASEEQAEAWMLGRHAWAEGKSPLCLCRSSTGCQLVVRELHWMRLQFTTRPRWRTL